MERSEARAAAMKLVYEWEMGGDGGEETVIGMLEIKPDDKETGFMNELFVTVRDNAPALDERIAKYAVDWKIDRINRVDLCILRVAVCELTLMNQAPAVAINEALELARAYSTPEAVSFINGVLGSLLRDL